MDLSFERLEVEVPDRLRASAARALTTEEMVPLRLEHDFGILEVESI